MIQKVEFRKIRDFGEIISDTFLFMKQNFKPLFKAFFYLCGFFLLAAMISTILQQIGMQKVINDGFVFRSDTSVWNTILARVFTFQYFLAILFNFIGYTSIYVAINSFIALYVEKDGVAPTVEQVWAYFKFYFLRVMGSTLLLSLCMILCLAACVIPFVYIFPAMCLFYPIMIIENADFSYSFSRCFKLLKDQWWVTAATIFVLWLITYATMAFASMPAVIIGLISGFTQGAKTMSTVMVVVTTVIQYLCYVFLVIPMIGTSLCYFNLVERQENTGLLDRIDQLGKPDANLNISPEEY